MGITQLPENSKLVIDTSIPVRTQSEQNCNEHWAEKAKRHKSQKFTTHIALLPYRKLIETFKVSDHQFVICLTRTAPRVMDFDNMVYSLKFVRDSISEFIYPGLPKGHADNHIDFHYDQQKGEPKEYAVQLKIFAF